MAGQSFKKSPTDHVMQFFAYTHLPPHLLAISEPCAKLADEMRAALPENPELTAGLRKLLEAKDCFVRARLSLPTDAPQTTPFPLTEAEVRRNSGDKNCG